MNPAFIIELLQAIIVAADSAEKTVAIAQQGIAVLRAGKEPTPEDWDRLNAQTAELRKNLHEDG